MTNDKHPEPLSITYSDAEIRNAERRDAERQQPTLPGIPETQRRSPLPHDIWTHRNGIDYQVMYIANIPDDERYPKTVVYMNTVNGTVWARRHDDWHRSFTFKSDLLTHVRNPDPPPNGDTGGVTNRLK